MGVYRWTCPTIGGLALADTDSVGLVASQMTVTGAAEEVLCEYCIPENMSYTEGLQSRFDIKGAPIPRAPVTPSHLKECSSKPPQNVVPQLSGRKNSDRRRVVIDTDTGRGKKRLRRTSDSEGTQSVSEVTSFVASSSITQLTVRLSRR